MASTTKEADTKSVEKVLEASTPSQIGNRVRSIYINSSTLTPDQTSKDNNRKRTQQPQDGSVKKRKSFVKKFRKEWMDEPIFRGWLQPIPNLSEKCWCSVCNVVLLCGHSELEKHASGKKHSDLMLLHQIKGDIMDSNSSAAVLDVSTLEDCRKDESSIDSTDLCVPALQMPAESNMDSHLVFHVTQDGTLVQMKMEDYEKITEAQEPENNSTKKVTPMSKGTVINVGSTTITKGNTPPLLKTQPTILRQTGKSSQQSIKLANQLTNALKNEEEKRRTMLAEQYLTDSEDEDYDDDDDLSDSQQMVKEMKAEVAYLEKKIMDQKRQEGDSGKTDSQINKLKDTDQVLHNVAEKELEVRLNLLQERRRQRFNIYKLKLQEMDARVRAAELELSRSEEIHKLRLRHLQLQIMQQEQYAQESLH